MSLSPEKKASNAMWGGRFTHSADVLMTAINASIDVDQRLWRQDIDGSLAHAAMLARTGILSETDHGTIKKGLTQIAELIETDQFSFTTDLEDIHMNIEGRLKAMIGDVAGRLHTARSRNDQVATDFRLWCRTALDRLMACIRALQTSLYTLASDHIDTIMPGFTHLQTAQPITFAHHLLAYVEMLERDYGRLHDTQKRLNESPLGACALAGTGFPIDRHMTAEALGFDRPMRNSLDAVSSRDFALEFLAGAAICSTHLSRLAEEIILWMTPQFGFIRLSDRWTTGSSIMPQKKNPDAAELVRGKTGRVTGALVATLTLMKSLPLAYAKDMQEDKAQVFDASDTLELCLAAMNGMISDMTPHKQRMRDACQTGFITATDLADWLVRSLGIPFREAHHITGTIVLYAEEHHLELSAVPLSAMQAIDARITHGVFDVLSVENSVRSRTSFGGTAPSSIQTQLQFWKDTLCM